MDTPYSNRWRERWHELATKHPPLSNSTDVIGRLTWDPNPLHYVLDFRPGNSNSNFHRNLPYLQKARHIINKVISVTYKIRCCFS